MVYGLLVIVSPCTFSLMIVLVKVEILVLVFISVAVDFLLADCNFQFINKIWYFRKEKGRINGSGNMWKLKRGFRLECLNRQYIC